MTTLGIDLGGTNVRCAAVDAEGHIVDDRQLPTPKTGLEDVVAVCAQLVAAMGQGRDARSVGVGAAGLVDRQGVVHFAPNIYGLVHAPLRDALAARTGLAVVVDNDATVAAMGEQAYGAARGVSDVLVVTLGTGIGGGIIVDGRVRRGAHGFAAEIGHFQIDPHGPQCACGEFGHWEALASGTALGRMGRERAESGRASDLLARAGGDAHQVTGVTVGDAARAGDSDAVEVVAEYAEFVAIGLAGLVNILDSDCVVISGGLVSLGDLLFAPLRTAFARRIEGSDFRPVVAVVPADLGEQAGVIGAAVMARDHA